tara:strand:+ start:870 stop:1157 length:288 start_codon:yes stop_codon:yes gene_type:complete
MFNPRYTQLLQRNATGNNLIPQTGGLSLGVNAVRTLNTTAPITPQVAIRRQGFGGRFEDTPPPFIADKKVDNKIERLKKPKKPNKKKKKKTRNKK